MAINQLRALPLGTSDFIALRMANEIYVDKTEMVFSLAVNRGKYFLARPRRFGKSLLISTFESLFNDMEPLCSLLDIGQNQRKKVFKKVKSCQSKGYL